MHGFRIGRVFGIDIRIDYSWLFIVVLLTWNLTAVFSVWHPGWSIYESAGVALTASLLFFGCILLHELAHSAVATRFGVRVRSITLFLFGGVSNIEREPPSAKAEFLMAIVGPITSILLGIGFLIAASLTTDLSSYGSGAAWTGLAGLGPLRTLLVWLGPINIIIGVFNLIPAFPLDGGRVLRSILWGLSGNLRASTRRASFIGRAFGWLFIMTGIAMFFGVRVPLFGSGFVSGLWLAFIGWFLQSAASQAYSRLAVDEALEGHVVSEVMRREAPVVSPELPLTTLVHDYFVRSDERALPVVRDDHPVGVVSISDVRPVPPGEWGATTVASVMQPWASVPTATPEEPLAEAFQELAQRDVDQLPVLEGGRLVGMLQRRDVARWLELAWGPIDGTGWRPKTGARTASTATSKPSPGAREPHAPSL
jgi:Zn-dependent protease/predicted transcriptional regulator